MAPIVTFFRRKMDTAMDEKKSSVAYASKDQTDTVKAVEDYSKSPPTRSGTGREENPCKKSSKPLSKRGHSKWRCKDVKQHPLSSKLSKDQYDTRLEA